MVGKPDEKFLLEPVRRIAAFRRLASRPATRAELQETLDASSATLHRFVTAMEDAGLAVETDDGVELTPVGREVGEAAMAYADRVAAAERVAPILNTIDPGDLPVSMSAAAFREAEVVLPSPSQPQRPVQHIVDAVDEADHLRATAPVVLPTYVDAVRRNILDGMTCELVLDAAALQVIVESYGDILDTVEATGRLDMRVHDDVPMGTMVTGASAAVVAFDGDGVLQGAVVGDDERLRSCAREAFEHYWDAADVLEGEAD